MTISNYPGAHNHKRQHEQLIDMVGSYIKKYNEDPSASNYDLLFFLKRWLVEHIMKDDKAMGDHLVKHGTIKSEHRETLFGRIKSCLVLEIKASMPPRRKQPYSGQRV